MDNHSFLVDYAIRYGVDGAIVLNHFHFWIKKNIANNKHMYEGRFWTYNSIAALCDLFPYWSKRQIERVLNNLVNDGVLIKGNFNKRGYDRTLWYTINMPFYTISPNGEMDNTKHVSSISPNGEMDFTKQGNGFPQTVTPIPYTITDSITDTTIVNTTDVVLTDLTNKSKKPRAKSSKVAARQAKAETLYTLFMDAYYVFFKERHDGVPPRIDGSSGNAAKSMIAYLKTVARSKHPDADESKVDSLVIEMIEFIFYNWQSIRPFIRDQYDLKQISSNINNIMADIKQTPVDERRVKNASDAYVYFKNYYNEKK